MFHGSFLRCLSLLLSGIVVVACTGTIGAPDGLDPTVRGGGPGASGGSVAPPAPAGAVFFQTAVKRLTRRELRQTVLDLTDIDVGTEVNNLPEDWSEAKDTFAFDNAYGLQQPSPALIETDNVLADMVGSKMLTTPAAQRKIVPCAPSGPEDVSCFRTFVTSFGKRALRRPLGDEEVEEIVAKLQPYSVEASDFYFGVSLAVRAFLQDPEFLYRIEVGVPVSGTPGLFKLNDYEVATRLSYFLWGTTPDDDLLQSAANGLQTPGEVKATAQRMLLPTERRAVDMVNEFHAMWLGYRRQPPPESLANAMLDETSNLIERVVFKERRPIFDIFKSSDTYVDAALASHYGLPAPAGGSGWVPYGTSGRQGILSHGTVLGVERKHEDTSPTMRGLFLRTRVMCQSIPLPGPEVNVDTDQAPKDGRCKTDRYDMWTRPVCKTCHTMMDPIGHGLEMFDRTGKARTVATQDLADNKLDCVISGNGFVDTPDNSFRGVAELSERLLATNVVENCFTHQVASYYLGREPRESDVSSPMGNEIQLFDEVARRFQDNGFRLDELLLDLVTLPAFGYRAVE
jgi:hypothetical protein